MEKFTHRLFDEIIELKSINSTSKYAEKSIKNKEIKGNFLVISETQTAGKGRNQNSWFSPKGGLWFTVGLYALPQNSNLTIFMGMCILKVLIKKFPELDFKIKWPNDIYLNEKKVCGILTSYLSFHKYHIVGIGINTNIVEIPKELNEIATTIRCETNMEVDNRTILVTIFDKFSTDLPNFIENGLDIKYFQKFDYLKSTKVTLNTDFDKFKGVVKGINKNGAILLQLQSGMIQPFYAGSILVENEV